MVVMAGAAYITGAVVTAASGLLPKPPPEPQLKPPGEFCLKWADGPRAAWVASAAAIGDAAGATYVTAEAAIEAVAGAAYIWAAYVAGAAAIMEAAGAA